jgi:hypothetical protein
MSAYEKRILELKNKFKIPEGRILLEGQQSAPDGGTVSLQEMIDERDRRDAKGLTLAYGSTQYKGERLRVWFTIR